MAEEFELIDTRTEILEAISQVSQASAYSLSYRWRRSKVNVFKLLEHEGTTMRAFSIITLFCAGVGLMLAGAPAGYAREPETVKLDFQHAIPNIPGKKLVAVVVNYPPGGKSLSHHHAKSAFIYAHVLTGAIRSVVGSEPAKVYQAGESFYEEPGAHHRVSENASETQPASLLAVFIVDAEDQPLTIPDSNSDKQ
jgi:quercetin dioxygenase-like cupin family protein